MVLTVFTATYELSMSGRGMYCGAMSYIPRFAMLHMLIPQESKAFVRTAFIVIEKSVTGCYESLVAWQSGRMHHFVAFACGHHVAR